MAARSPSTDRFESLDRAIEATTEEAVHARVGDDGARADFNRAVIADFWGIWKSFHEIGVPLVLEPGPATWAIFADTIPSGSWTWRPGFNARSVTAIGLVDPTTEQGRAGDALTIVHYELHGESRVRAAFEYCVGETYHKSSGWRRIRSRHTLIESSLEHARRDRVVGVIAEVAKVWRESHLRRNRDVLIRFLKNAYPKAETFAD